MDIEELRNYCLTLSPEVEEKFPFQQFKAAKDVLAFYIGGHIFCYFDINDLTHVTVKCPNEKVMELIERYDYIDHPLCPYYRPMPSLASQPPRAGAPWHQ